MHAVFKIILLIFLSIVPYVFYLNGEFVFDDSEAVVKNKDLNLDNSFWDVFHHDFWGSDIKSKLSHKSYRPLTILSFRFNKYLDNDVLIPKHFKIVNLCLHIIATVLFYKFVHNIYKHGYKSLTTNKNRFSYKNIWKDVPFLSSVLFAVHPIHVEAVSGIVGRADLLSTIFFLLSIIFYDLSIDKYSRNLSLNVLTLLIHCFYFLSTIIFAILATLSKETGIMVLCLCGIYDVVLIQKLNIPRIISNLKFLTNRNKSDGEFHGQIFSLNFHVFVIRVILLFISFSIILYVRWAIMDFEGPKFQAIDNPSAFNESQITRIITYNYIYFLNIVILIWPQWLCFDWSMGCIPVLNGLFDVRFFFVILFWCFIIFILCKTFFISFHNTQQRRLNMTINLIVVTFLPASNIFLPVGFVIAERILYMPSGGFCILIVQGLLNLFKNYEMTMQKLLKVGFIVLVCVMLARSLERSKKWMNESLLYSSGVEVCPLNAKVHYNIAKTAADDNNHSIAENEYKEAIRLNPSYHQAMNNLANLLKDQNRFSEAEFYLRNALKLKEDFPAAWMNLGIVLANLKQLSESENAYKTALMYRKKYADCYYNLGNLYLDQNKNDLALKSWFEATKLNPKHIVAWSNTFALLDNTGQIKEALNLAPKVLSLLPEVPAIHFNLANIYGKNGDFETAEQHFIKAIDLKYDAVPALYYANLGVLYHRWKKKELAIQMYEKALSINPTMKSARDNLHKLMNSI